MSHLHAFHPLLHVHGLKKTYSTGAWWKRRKGTIALNHVDLTLYSGRTLALVGHSGCGKTTLALCLAALERPDAGEILYENGSLASFSRRELAVLRTRVQVVLQDSAGALSPRFTAAQIIEEPMLIQRRGSPQQRAGRVAELMERVGLSPDWKDRRAHQFSGGQRQRLAIARALAMDAKLLILDEPFNGLDLSVRGQIINLLLDLQADLHLSYLYISHDLDVVRHFADDVAVMQAGRIVECSPTLRLFEQPVHPHTQVLLSAMSLWTGQSSLSLVH